MKARINSDFSFGGIYTNEFLSKNKNIVVNGQLVSHWLTVEVSDEEASILKEGYQYIYGVWLAPPYVEPVIEVPQTISRMKFIIQVFLTTGIKYEDIVLFIQNLVFNEAQKYIILTRLRSATHFDRNSNDLLTISQMMQITSNQLDEIFTEGNKLD